MISHGIINHLLYLNRQFFHPILVFVTKVIIFKTLMKLIYLWEQLSIILFLRWFSLSLFFPFLLRMFSSEVFLQLVLRWIAWFVFFGMRRALCLFIITSLELLLSLLLIFVIFFFRYGCFSCGIEFGTCCWQQHSLVVSDRITLDEFFEFFWSTWAQGLSVCASNL